MCSSGGGTAAGLAMEMESRLILVESSASSSYGAAEIPGDALGARPEASRRRRGVSSTALAAVASMVLVFFGVAVTVGNTSVRYRSAVGQEASGDLAAAGEIVMMKLVLFPA